LAFLGFPPRAPAQGVEGEGFRKAKESQGGAHSMLAFVGFSWLSLAFPAPHFSFGHESGAPRHRPAAIGRHRGVARSPCGASHASAANFSGTMSTFVSIRTASHARDA